jgi:hypothetical protein
VTDSYGAAIGPKSAKSEYLQTRALSTYLKSTRPDRRLDDRRLFTDDGLMNLEDSISRCRRTGRCVIKRSVIGKSPSKRSVNKNVIGKSSVSKKGIGKNSVSKRLELTLNSWPLQTKVRSLYLLDAMTLVQIAGRRTEDAVFVGKPEKSCWNRRMDTRGIRVLIMENGSCTATAGKCDC